MKKINNFFEVVFDNENFIAINKKTNLSTEKNKFYKDSVEGILEKIGEPYSLLERCGIVHRIDRNTTGLLLIAKNFRYQKILLKIFKEKRIKKIYLSLNNGEKSVRTGSVKMFLKKTFSSKQNVRMTFGGPSDKFIQINFEKVSSTSNLSLFKVEAITGKTHQIRIAFESIKLPIYNDEIYNKGASKDFKFTAEGHYLHCYMLKFFDGYQHFEFFAKLPNFFSDKIMNEKMKIKDKEVLSLI